MRPVEPEAPHAAVRVIRPDGSETYHPLDRPVLQIGSAREACDLVLTDLDISAEHCCLRRRNGRWWLLDRGSANGTYLNGRRCLEPTVLRDGDHISVGLHLLEFHASAPLPTITALTPASRPDLTPATPHTAIPPSRRLVKTACLAALAAFAVTFPIAACLASTSPKVHVPSDMSQPPPHLILSPTYFPPPARFTAFSLPPSPHRSPAS